MKNISNKIILSLSVLFLFLVTGLKQVQAQNTQVSFQLFYDELSPYGQWINDSQYGYIWLPDVRGDFRPYATNGHWINTEYGNTWYSDYDWGWAPFHYGSWIYNNNYGWAWVPGYEWGPAWVSWRQGGGQYGWAPLGPGVSFGISINIPLSHWVFVPQRYFFSPRIYSYFTPFNRYNSFYNRTTIINNVYVYNNRSYYGGPGRSELARVTRTPVRVYNVNNSSRPGRAVIDSRSVSIYRPQINQNSQSTSRPNRVVSATDVRRNERPATTRSSERPNAANNTGRTVTRPEQGRATSVRSNSGNSGNNGGSTAARPTTQRPATPNPARSAAPAQRQNNNVQGRTTAPARQVTAPSPSATQSRSTPQRSTPVRQAAPAARAAATRVSSSSSSKGSSAAASGRSTQPSQSRARSDRNSR